MYPLALTPTQQQVLALISAGSPMSHAAQEAGVHRNTVHNWIQSVPAFSQALSQARYWKAIFWREQAESLAAAALDTIRATMTDHSVPASLRLKAAQSILALACTPPPEPHSPAPEFFSFPVSLARQPRAKSLEPLHNPAQLPPDSAPAQEAAESAPHPPDPAPAADPTPGSVPNSAQSALPPRQPFRRDAPKIGRNDLCPCGSGKKFKRCCQSLADAGRLHAAA
jgi:hypothetical protein